MSERLSLTRQELRAIDATEAALRDRNELSGLSRLYDCRFETERLLTEGFD